MTMLMMGRNRPSIPGWIKVTMAMAAISTVIAMMGPPLKNFYITANPLLLGLLFLFAISTIMVSAALTYSVSHPQLGALAWILVVLLGLMSFFFFVGWLVLAFRFVQSEGKGYVALGGGIAVTIVSLCFNLMVKNAQDQKARQGEDEPSP